MANNAITSLANTTLTTNFNVSPYYDDYDVNKEFYRILYKPGYAVQARELTQMQTILQSQINRFGKNIFREGSMVLPGQYNIETDVPYVKIRDVDNTNTSVKISNFKNLTLTGQTTGITAYVEEVLDGVETDDNSKTIYLSYLTSSQTNTSITTFQPDEVLIAANGLGNIIVANTVPVGANTITGKGSRFKIEPGVIFAKEHFISFDRQSIIIGRYTQSPSAKVGFFITESIVDYTQDISLLDPARGASNYAAPGADRFKLSPTLISYSYDVDPASPNFVETFSIKDGIINQTFQNSQYNIIGDEMAKRTFDESGDYYVYGLNVRTRENLDTGSNGGLSPTGNSQLLSVGVEPGVGYVKGYHTSILTTRYVDIEKSLTSATVTNQVTTASSGNYIKVNEFIGSLALDQGNIITLYDKAEKRLSGKTFTASPTGNSIGTARVMSIQYDNGLLGTQSGVVDVYLTDVRMNGTNSFASVRSIYASGFGGDNILDNAGNATLLESGTSTLLYAVGATGVKSIRDGAGNPQTAFNFLRTTSVSNVAAPFTVSLTTSGIGEQFPYGTSTLSVGDKREIMLSLGGDATVSLTGTVSGSGGSNTLSGALTTFTKLNVGDKIAIDGKSNTFFIQAITNDTTLTLTEVLPPGISGNSFTKVYKSGDLIDLTSIGATTGLERSVTATPTQLTVDLKESFTGGVSGKITYPVYRSAALQANKLLKQNRYVLINCATAGTTGPFSLGFPDIYQIKKIVKKTGSAPSTLNDGTNVTTSFTLDNGQRDSFYDLGTITPNIALGSTDYLLVQLDYFYPDYSTGFGFFCVDSYPIDDSASPAAGTIRTENIPFFKSPISRTSYNLREFLDFRPVKAATASDATTIGGASTNPATSAAFIYDTNGLRIPVPSTPINYAYNYYLLRNDIVCMDVDGNITVVRGVPSSTPATPEAPANAMALATIQIPPYPSLAANYGQQINRRDIACSVSKMTNIRYTMRDIGVLKNRIDNLEYYASLNLLEKAATSMQIVDQNGLNRFKNGIFVDTFADTSFVDTKDGARIVVDPQEKSIRPFYTMHSSYYDYVAGSNITQNGDIITLPYTEKVLIDQPRVSSYRNIELSTYRFIGQVELYPATDVWADVDQLPDEVIYQGVDPATVKQGTVTTWNQWSTQITGLLSQSALFTDKNTFNSWGPPRLITSAELSTIVQNGGVVQNTLPKISHNDYRITQLSANTRTGTATTTSIKTDNQTIGNRILDVSVVPYIRPQVVNIRVIGLKPFTRFHCFFDGEKVDQYIRPLTINEFVRDTIITAVPLGYGLANPPNFPIGYTYAEGVTSSNPLVSDANGTVFLSLRINQGAFRIGSREFIITDSPTNAADASTYAKNQFVAYGLQEQKQNTVLSTRSLNVTTTPVQETVNANTVYYINNIDCSAYTFLPKAPQGEEGVFLTSVDLYFQAVHPTLGVWIEIREMDTAGGITRKQVPFSEVWVPADDIKPYLSDDASKAKNIKFQAPVFLYSDVQYALIIHAVALNPDCYFWVSRLGETDVRTGKQINSRPTTGTFYTTNNNLNWDIVPDVDLKVTFYRAAFSTGVLGQAVLGTRGIERIIANNITGTLSTQGEIFEGRAKLTLSDVLGNSSALVVGDRLIGANSGVNSAIISIDTGKFVMANNQYLYNEIVSLANANGTLYGKTSTISYKSKAKGILSFYKNLNGVNDIEMTSSNGQFFVGDVMTGTRSGDSFTVQAMANQRYSVVDFEPGYLKFNKTTITFEMQPTSNTGVKGSYVSVIDGDNTYFDTEQALLSRTYENGVPSNNVRVNMVTTSEYQSPVLDLGRTHTVFVDNLINANIKGEAAVSKLKITDANGSINIGSIIIGANSGANSVVDANSSNFFTMSGGGYANGEYVIIYDSTMTQTAVGNVSAKFDVNSISSGELINKYINFPITLAEGQDAEDIMVLMTAYRPYPTDVKVWIKLLNNQDSDKIDDRPWIELVKDDTVYSSISDRNDFKELAFKFPDTIMNPDINDQQYGVVQYTNTKGVKFNGYKVYSIKIGLLGAPANSDMPVNSAIVPRVADLRVINLQL